jgi:hypothetical protein
LRLFGGLHANRSRAPACRDPEIEERAALAAGSVPPLYLDAWARLQCQQPSPVSQERWRTTINDGGLFLDAWGEQAAELGWTAGELFDVPHDGERGGLIWFMQGERIAGLHAQRALTDGGRTFGRLTNDL